MRAFAQWNPERDLWETDQGDLLSGLSDVYSETWPRSGMTRAGTAYALPMWVPLMDGSASSSSPLLPTPTTQDGANTGGPSQFDRNSLPLNTLVLTLP